MIAAVLKWNQSGAKPPHSKGCRHFNAAKQLAIGA